MDGSFSATLTSGSAITFNARNVLAIWDDGKSGSVVLVGAEAFVVSEPFRAVDIALRNALLERTDRDEQAQLARRFECVLRTTYWKSLSRAKALAGSPEGNNWQECADYIKDALDSTLVGPNVRLVSLRKCKAD